MVKFAVVAETVAIACLCYSIDVVLPIRADDDGMVCRIVAAFWYQLQFVKAALGTISSN